MGTTAVILMLVLYVLMLAAGIYFKSYFDKKGANLATKEDFDDLKTQTAELRQATKEIEAKIDDQMWNKQRQWEMKRDAILEAARCIADLDAMLVRLDAVMKVKSLQPEASDRVKSFFIEKQNESTKALNDADNELTRAHITVSIVGSAKVSAAFDAALSTLRDVSQKVLTDGAVDQYSANRQRIQKSLVILVTAIQAELMAPTPQSSGSLATQAPDSPTSE